MAEKTTVPGIDIAANSPDLAVEPELGLSDLRGPISFVKAREELAASSAIAQMPSGELAKELATEQVGTVLRLAAGYVSRAILAQPNSGQVLTAAGEIKSVAIDEKGGVRLAA